MSMSTYTARRGFGRKSVDYLNCIRRVAVETL
jgi:hypothetical protein